MGDLNFLTLKATMLHQLYQNFIYSNLLKEVASKVGAIV